MPVLRLFAAAREAAGTASVEVPGVTVDEVLAAARARFGPELGAVIDASKVWRNGEPAVGSDPVGDRDEVAVLPPVSGGSGPGEPDGRRARRTFAPAEPPPSTGRPPAPRRSPRAEAAVRRAEDRRPGTAARRTPAPDGRRGAPGARRAPVRGADPDRGAGGPRLRPGPAAARIPDRGAGGPRLRPGPAATRTPDRWAGPRLRPARPTRRPPGSSRRRPRGWCRRP
ncbi:hypothetical protein HC251_22080 [Iamia sp. SCSIO 61187]|uniref:MoaD/ThiS family protein n=1 Tax=Iamia sp. SCSIO 61187 TaxID=2722752 RepID=UPI001C639370|nr:MoaD/ThiS family protein [Iamia sp. SCSIO 61187]QYG94850.1 hypothetical protein HC251_22080 [Iamia sp. SCSIO 61187]